MGWQYIFVCPIHLHQKLNVSAGVFACKGHCRSAIALGEHYAAADFAQPGTVQGLEYAVDVFAALLFTLYSRSCEFDILTCLQRRLQSRNGMLIDLTHIDHHPEIIK